MPGSEATCSPNSCKIAVGWTKKRKAETFTLGNSNSCCLRFGGVQQSRQFS